MAYRLLLSMSAAVWLAACSSATKARVVETEDGSVAAIGTAKNESDAVLAAVDQAQNYCSSTEKKPIFKKELTQPEKTAKSPKINWKKVPVIGGAFEEEQPRVVVQFACR